MNYMYNVMLPVVGVTGFIYRALVRSAQTKLTESDRVRLLNIRKGKNIFQQHPIMIITAFIIISIFDFRSDFVAPHLFWIVFFLVSFALGVVACILKYRNTKKIGLPKNYVDLTSLYSFLAILCVITVMVVSFL